MARARKQSDDVYNARRRFRREAQRYLAKAEKSSGATKARYEAQAREATIKAMRTYGKGQKVQGQVKQLADKLRITQTEVQRARGGKALESESGLKRLIESSKAALESTKRLYTRDDLARSILSNGNIGSRFYGGLVSIWGTTPEGRKHPNQAIIDYFGVNSIMDVIEMIEEAGIDLYAPDYNDDVYKSVQLQLMQFVLINRRIV